MLWDSDKVDLLNKTIKEFWVDSNKYYVCFVTDAENILFRAASESHSADSWFEEINGIENLIDSKILSIQVKRFPETKERNNFIKTIGYSCSIL